MTHGPAFNLSIWSYGLLTACVFIEPAPVDVAGVLISFGYLIAGGSLPTRLAAPALASLLLLLANLGQLCIGGTSHLGDQAMFAAVTAYLIAISMVIAAMARGAAFDSLMKGWLAGGLLSVGLSLAAFAVPDMPGEQALFGGQRARGLFKDPNVFGAYLVPLCTYSVAVLLTSATVAQRLRYSAFIAALLIGVFLSFSRGAWINLTVSITAFGVIAIRAGMLSVRSFVLMVLILGLGGFFALITLDFLDLRDLLFARISLQEYDEDRFATQAKALRIVTDNIGGIGPGLSESELAYATHSLYVRVLLENGIHGFIAMLTLICAALAIGARAIARQQSRTALILVPSLLGALANALVIDTLHWRHFWLLLFLCCSIASYREGIAGNHSGRTWRRTKPRQATA
jgi:O-antigen ligase